MKNNVESIFGVIKRIFDGTIEAKAYNYQIKKQNSKTQYTTYFTNQHKFKKNENFCKAITNLIYLF